MENSQQNVSDSGKKQLPRWVVIVVFAVLLGFLALIGWGLKNAQQGPVQIGQKVPDFELTSFDGQKFATEDLRGKVIVLNFWASWCKPCEQEAAELEEAWNYYKDSGEVQFLGVDYVDTEPEALAYLEKYQITYPNGPDLRTTISQIFRISGVPETYIIDKEGKLAARRIGPFMSLGEITSMIDSVLSQ
jgi:cytochrome c biogenesis protein CcmG/thiol:disulfide interchange protein DsbE